MHQKHKRGPWTQKGNEKFKAHRVVTVTKYAGSHQNLGGQGIDVP